LWEKAKLEKLYQINIIKDANHIFSSDSSQEQLSKIVQNWIIENYPAKKTHA